MSKSDALETFVNALRSQGGENLQSVILYGLAVQRPETTRPEETQVVILFKELKSSQLDAIQPAVQQWLRKRHPMPKIFTVERFLQSADIFPIEYMEILNHHRICDGIDVTDRIKVTRANLRLQLETEFKGKLLQLREGYLAAANHPKNLTELLSYSFGSLEPILNALCDWLGGDGSASLEVVVQQLSEKLSLDLDVFETLDSLRAENAKMEKSKLKPLFDRYLSTLERISDFVDQHASHESNS